MSYKKMLFCCALFTATLNAATIEPTQAPTPLSSMLVSKLKTALRKAAPILMPLGAAATAIGVFYGAVSAYNRWVLPKQIRANEQEYDQKHNLLPHVETIKHPFQDEESVKRHTNICHDLTTDLGYSQHRPWLYDDELDNGPLTAYAKRTDGCDLSCRNKACNFVASFDRKSLDSHVYIAPSKLETDLTSNAHPTQKFPQAKLYLDFWKNNKDKNSRLNNQSVSRVAKFHDSAGKKFIVITTMTVSIDPVTHDGRFSDIQQVFLPHMTNFEQREKEAAEISKDATDNVKELFEKVFTAVKTRFANHEFKAREIGHWK